MNRRRIGMAIGAFLVVVVLIVLLAGTFVISETEQAIVVRLGRTVRVIVGEQQSEKVLKEVKEHAAKLGIAVSRGPGLYFKLPFVEEVVVYDDRLLEYDDVPELMVTADKKRLMVDNFARWRIVDPLQYRQGVETEARARARLQAQIRSALREELGKANMVEIVRSSNDLIEKYPARTLDAIRENWGRDEIMRRVTERANGGPLFEAGIEVIDVRIKRADLVPENETAVFNRMNAERNRISEQYRAEGNKERQKIEAEADKQVEIILAEATKQAEILMGEGDAKAASIYAAAYEPHREFYSFVRSLEALQKAMAGKTKIVIGTDSPLFRLLKERASAE